MMFSRRCSWLSTVTYLRFFDHYYRHLVITIPDKKKVAIIETSKYVHCTDSWLCLNSEILVV